MKKLLFILLLFSSSVYSQNYLDHSYSDIINRLETKYETGYDKDTKRNYIVATDESAMYYYAFNANYICNIYAFSIDGRGYNYYKSLCIAGGFVEVQGKFYSQEYTTSICLIENRWWCIVTRKS